MPSNPISHDLVEYGPLFQDVDSSRCRRRFPVACHTSSVPVTLARWCSSPHFQEAAQGPLPSSGSLSAKTDPENVIPYAYTYLLLCLSFLFLLIAISYEYVFLICVFFLCNGDIDHGHIHLTCHGLDTS